MSTSTTSLQPHHLANTSLALSTFIALNNAYGILKPRTALDMLGFPTPVSPSDQKLVSGLQRMHAATRVVLGLTGIAMWWYRDYRALAWSSIIGVLMAGTDGYVSKEVTGKGEWGHWGAAPVGLGLGVALLYLVGT